MKRITNHRHNLFRIKVTLKNMSEEAILTFKINPSIAHEQQDGARDVTILDSLRENPTACRETIDKTPADDRRTDSHAYGAVTKTSVLTAEKAQPFLGLRPIEVIRRTLEETTQLAKLTVVGNMKRHRKSLFPVLNRKRLQETVATDTLFAESRDVTGANAHKYSTE
jgi:hypothetical protein